MDYQSPRHTTTATMVSGGRIQIPAAMRKQLGLKDGDSIILEIKDNELLVRTYDQSIKRAQDRFRHLRRAGQSMSEELIADRRKDAERE